MYLVSEYEELPHEPSAPREYGTLAALLAAEGIAYDDLDRTLAGESYNDGSVHVGAVYDDEHQSSGVWVTYRDARQESDLRDLRRHFEFAASLEDAEDVPKDYAAADGD